MRRRHVLLDGSAGGFPPTRIALVSDFHFQCWNGVFQEARDVLVDTDYDVLVATGDFGHRPSDWRRVADLTGRFFASLAARGPVYGVLGNHDHPSMAACGGLPIRFLNNRRVRIGPSGSGLVLAGIDQSLFGVEDLGAALGVSRDGPTVLLAHYPSTVFRLPSGRVDLQLSGHTHGGQIRLPRVGCIWPNDRIPRSMAWGLHRVDGTLLYVTAGIGVSGPIRARWGCPPEVTLLTVEGVSEGVKGGQRRCEAAVAGV